jgi:Zn-finger nucleic acid-binding protein
MNCPVCSTTQLSLAERQGIEIDYCPSCRGVWLDRGELDKLIERAESTFGRSRRESGEYGDDDHDADDRGSMLGGGRSRRRGSLLGDFFDFG